MMHTIATIYQKPVAICIAIYIKYLIISTLALGLKLQVHYFLLLYILKSYILLLLMVKIFVKTAPDKLYLHVHCTYSYMLKSFILPHRVYAKIC